MPRRPPPPDFRYIGLSPGKASAAAALAAGTLGVVGCSVALWNSGHEPLSLGLTLAGSAAAALALAHAGGEKRPPSRGGREVPMAIVPWGVVVTPDTEPRVLRWTAIRRIEVDVAHTLRGGTPGVVSSLVTVHAGADVLAGRAFGSVELERLLVNLEGYADESSRPISSDLDGLRAVVDGLLEPVAGVLLGIARELCAGARGAADLALAPLGYRSACRGSATPETVALLRTTLESPFDTPADPRPLAAAVAGTLGAEELVPQLVDLVSSPHPVVAAFAKAAALRLGAPPNRAGAVDEVAAFLFDEDVEALVRWSEAEL